MITQLTMRHAGVTLSKLERDLPVFGPLRNSTKNRSAIFRDSTSARSFSRTRANLKQLL